MNKQLFAGYVPSSHSDYQIHHHKQDTLKPVRLAITNKVVNEEDSNEEDDDLECVEVEGLKSLV
jgi:hypothetical protein